MRCFKEAGYFRETPTLRTFSNKISNCLSRLKRCKLKLIINTILSRSFLGFSFLSLGACHHTDMHYETIAVDQPFAFNCSYPPITNGAASVRWYAASKIPVSKDIQHRIHQEQTWILFLPLNLGDSGIYYCVVK
jgi:hypothetical protein